MLRLLSSRPRLFSNGSANPKHARRLQPIKRPDGGPLPQCSLSSTSGTTNVCFNGMPPRCLHRLPVLTEGSSERLKDYKAALVGKGLINTSITQPSKLEQVSAVPSSLNLDADSAYLRFSFKLWPTCESWYADIGEHCAHCSQYQRIPPNHGHR